MVGLRRAVRRGRIRPSLSLEETPVVLTAVAAREAPDACPSVVCKAASFYILEGGSPPCVLFAVHIPMIDCLFHPIYPWIRWNKS